MATPSPKSTPMEQFLEKQYGRTTSITSDRCVKPPFGCGGEAKEFRDRLSENEYRISGQCQACQDKAFSDAS